MSLPTVLPASNPQPSDTPWPTVEWPRSTAANHSALNKVVDLAFTNADLESTHAVLVIQGGRILAERYNGAREFFDRPPEPITAESTLLSWSMAKSMLHCIVGTLVDEARLDPFERAPVPEWRDPSDPRHAIRLADLLSMRDGLDFVEDYVDGGVSHVIEMLFASGKDDMAGFAASRPSKYAPDTVFNYSSGTTNIISRIVADQVGYADAYRHALQQRLFEPIGMNSAKATFDAKGVFVGSSYVYATAEDFARFGLLYLRGGLWDTKRIVSEAWTHTAQIPLSVEEESGSFYGWQWWITGDQFGTYRASGYEGQMIAIAPALDAIIVRLGKTPEANYPELQAWRSQVLNVLANA
jgi:CubicO group peptidase (beta-lactamase class C family)